MKLRKTRTRKCTCGVTFTPRSVANRYCMKCRPRYSECVDCGKAKIGPSRQAPRCAPCAYEERKRRPRDWVAYVACIECGSEKVGTQQYTAYCKPCSRKRAGLKRRYVKRYKKCVDCGVEKTTVAQQYNARCYDCGKIEGGRTRRNGGKKAPVAIKVPPASSRSRLRLAFEEASREARVGLEWVEEAMKGNSEE